MLIWIVTDYMKIKNKEPQIVGLIFTILMMIWFIDDKIVEGAAEKPFMDGLNNVVIARTTGKALDAASGELPFIVRQTYFAQSIIAFFSSPLQNEEAAQVYMLNKLSPFLRTRSGRSMLLYTLGIVVRLFFEKCCHSNDKNSKSSTSAAEIPATTTTTVSAADAQEAVAAQPVTVAHAVPVARAVRATPTRATPTPSPVSAAQTGAQEAVAAQPVPVARAVRARNVPVPLPQELRRSPRTQIKNAL
jgi:hypothetical protein